MKIAANTHALLTICVALGTGSAARAQTGYTFSSGPTGDGFTWPASPTGLLDGNSYITPDGVEFYNYIGNNLFFDAQYQVAGNASGITGDAMWGNPLDDYIDVDFFTYGAAQTVAFDIAFSVGGSPGATPDYVDVYVEDFDGRATVVTTFLGEVFTGLGGFDGYAGTVDLDYTSLEDDFFNFDGGPFVDIAYISIYLGDLNFGGPSSEFGIDNFNIDGGGTGSGEVFPSVNGGTIDVTGSALGHSVLRGTGGYSTGIEVTNGSTNNTTFSTQLVPGGGLTDAGQANNVPILTGQTLWSGSIVSINKSSPSATYDSDIVVVNDLYPSDPDNTVTLRVRLVEPPVLTTSSPVDLSAGDKVELHNASAPTNGHRASVKVTGTSVIGPFGVTGYGADTPCKPGEMIVGDATFNRFGRLSGNHNGTFIASLDMTFFVGASNEFEVFLVGAEPVPDEQWALQATLADTPSDGMSFGASDALGPDLVGVNSATSAATIVGGSATSAGSVSMALGAPVSGLTTSVIGGAADIVFSSTVPAYAIQLTYRDADLCAAINEGNLRVLYYNGGAGDWQPAINGNSDGGAGATFFANSFDDFLGTLGGAPLSTALGTYGLDTTNNRVWAIVDHEATFGTGELGQSCAILGDMDSDGDVDKDDYTLWASCLSGPNVSAPSGCENADFNSDGDVDLADFALFSDTLAGD